MDPDSESASLIPIFHQCEVRIANHDNPEYARLKFPAFLIPILKFALFLWWTLAYEYGRNVPYNLNLHTAWLENHALTLKNKTAKYYFGEESCILQSCLTFYAEPRKILVKFKIFFLLSVIVFKKVNLNVWQTCHDLFLISGSESITYWMLYYEWLQSQHYESSNLPPSSTRSVDDDHI